MAGGPHPPSGHGGATRPARRLVLLAGQALPAGHQALGRLVDLAAFALERWRYDQLLLHAARHDQLTDLPNREQFFGRLRSSLGRAGDQHPVAVLYLDLDGFKAVNDTHGHGVGDRLLEIVAHRLQGSVRSGDLIARLGGDEFAVVCPGIADAGEAGDLADRLIAAVEEPVVVGALRLAVGASVGIALGQAGEDPDAVLHRADAALYAVKRSGRGAWRLAGDIEPA
ncbi:MAG: GGDEF domain-containing protein [Acidimicrobiales bacterium]